MLPAMPASPLAVPAPGALTPAPAPAATDRKLELDWLRLGAIALVFVFHTARFFDPWGWHVKNPTVHPWLMAPETIFITWAMPLLFVISGAGVSLSLRRRTVATYVRERVLRVLVPLVVGVFTHVLWQVYLERSTHGQFDGSFLEFVPRYFDGWYGYGGNFAWMGLHLWYLELLFAFSLALLPVFLWSGTGRGRRVVARVCGLLARPGGPFLLAVPVALAAALPAPASFWGTRSWGGWNLLSHACFFGAGFLVVADERLYQSVRRHWLPATLVAAGIGGPLAATFIGAPEPAHGSLRAWVMLGGMALVGWSAIVALLGGAIGGLHAVQARFLARASALVLPFYVLHQTVILTVGWVVVRWAVPDLARWAIIAVGSLAATLAGCEVVRRAAPLRVLFGMKARSG
jgi:peptidoglycan/LPS O-acetylase OafA/YrhL